MTLVRLASLVLCVGLAAAWALPCRAAPYADPRLADCDDDDRQSTLERVDEAPAEVRAPAQAPAQAIVPCALVESGQLGPACADATFYLLSIGGTTLCEVDVVVLQAASSGQPHVKPAPLSTSTVQQAHGQVATAASAPAVPPCLVTPREVRAAGRFLSHADGVRSSRLKPS